MSVETMQYLWAIWPFVSSLSGGRAGDVNNPAVLIFPGVRGRWFVLVGFDIAPRNQPSMEFTPATRAKKFALQVAPSKGGSFLIRLGEGAENTAAALEHALRRLHAQGIIRMGVSMPNVRKYPDPDCRTWHVLDAATKDAILASLPGLPPEPLPFKPYAEWLQKYEAACVAESF